MIGLLRGQVLEKHPNRVIVDVHGVGYEVHVPLSTYYQIGDEGSDVTLRVYTHVREEALQLYGFLTDLERQLFERLIGISGIGPKLAVALLSGMEPRDLLAAVQRADVARLTGVPGIGKKTAERIVLELKDRVAGLGFTPAAEAPSASPEDQLKGDVLSALQNLGYHRPLAEKALEAAFADAVGGASPASFERVFKGALKALMRP
jgi:Holliday junction DNA helicase RuvA